MEKLRDLLSEFKQSDRITRTFRKDRGSSVVDYKMVTFSNALFPMCTNFQELSKFFDYLDTAFVSDLMIRELSCSNANELVLDFEQDNACDVVYIASQVNYEGMGNKQHDIIQEFFIRNNLNTVAIELPVWDHERQGFIDIVRVLDNGKIQILDFKPNAHKEKPQKVLTQLFHYKKMLCELTGISPDMVECAYFDNKNCYKLKH